MLRFPITHTCIKTPIEEATNDQHRIHPVVPFPESGVRPWGWRDILPALRLIWMLTKTFSASFENVPFFTT